MLLAAVGTRYECNVHLWFYDKRVFTKRDREMMMMMFFVSLASEEHWIKHIILVEPFWSPFFHKFFTALLLVKDEPCSKTENVKRQVADVTLKKSSLLKRAQIVMDVFTFGLDKKSAKLA